MAVSRQRQAFPGVGYERFRLVSFIGRDHPSVLIGIPSTTKGLKLILDGIGIADDGLPSLLRFFLGSANPAPRFVSIASDISGALSAWVAPTPAGLTLYRVWARSRAHSGTLRIEVPANDGKRCPRIVGTSNDMSHPLSASGLLSNIIRTSSSLVD